MSFKSMEIKHFHVSYRERRGLESSLWRKMPPGGVFAMNVIGQGGQIRRAFLIRSGNVFERVGRSRYPIKHITGPAAPQMLGNPVVGPWIEAKMYQRLGINLDHELAYFLG